MEKPATEPPIDEQAKSEAPNAEELKAAKKSYLDRTDTATKIGTLSGFLGTFISISTSLMMMTIGIAFNGGYTAAAALLAGNAAVQAGIAGGLGALIATPAVIGLFALTLGLVGTSLYLNYKSSRIYQNTGFDQVEVSASRTAEHIVHSVSKMRAEEAEKMQEMGASNSNTVNGESASHADVNKRTDGISWADAIIPPANTASPQASR